MVIDFDKIAEESIMNFKGGHGELLTRNYFNYDGNVETVTAGQVHYCPEGHSHFMENNSDVDLRYLAIVPEHHCGE